MANHLRWLTLFLNCLILIGNYYAYDNPAALATLLRPYLKLPEEGGASFDFIFGLFYSAYSLPNVILPFLAGQLIDRLGVGRVLPGLSVCVCVGQALFLLGVKWRLIWLMLLGRTVFGIGGESVSVAQRYGPFTRS
jgi:MFS family permease